MTWKIRGYIAEELIGYGASSEVWRGRSTRTGQLVALKKVLCEDAEQLRAAQGEADLLAALDHAHLIRLHAAVPSTGALVLVLDLADAGSLADLLHSRGRLTQGEVASALAPIGAALAYAHERRVIHGDVSAGNVLFTGFGLSLLADLGMARLVENEDAVHGTAASMSPEVALGAIAQTPSDVFSLAAVVFHALTGRSVWGGGTGAEMIANARRGAIEVIEDGLPGVAPELVRLLAKTLVAEAHRRPSAAEFALELRLSVPLEPVELTAGRPRPEPIPPAGGRHRRVVAERSSSTAGRPSFERPPVAAPDRGQLTHGVRIALAPPPHRRRFSRVAMAIGVAVLLALVAGSGGGYWYLHRRSASPSDFAQQLAVLDGLRQQAFAQRRPDLLDRVYASGPLRTRDAALLERLVPAGCGLMGVHTTYQGVRTLSSTPGHVELAVSATLAPSTLQCGATTAGSAPGAPSTPLRISLQRDGPDFVIAGLRRSA